MVSDAQPDKIFYAIRLSLLAKYKKLNHLPHFTAMLISEHCLQMKVPKPELCLRDALAFRDNMAQCGHLLIKGLLETLLELRRVDATLHTLEPKSIFISPQALKLVVSNPFGICFKGKRVLE